MKIEIGTAAYLDERTKKTITKVVTLSIDVPFPALLSALISRRSQVKPATLQIPIDLYLFLLVEEFHGTRYQSGNAFSLINVGNGCSLPA
jgi:hypothetical protein